MHRTDRVAREATSFKLSEARCCDSWAFATCLVPELNAQHYMAKCTKTSKLHNLPSHQRICVRHGLCIP
eukprot:6196049-Pleurochrysis_carterae.AAC.1